MESLTLVYQKNNQYADKLDEINEIIDKVKRNEIKNRKVIRFQ